MSKKLFTNEEIELLLKKKYVKNVTSKGITYTDEFRKIFISEIIVVNFQDKYLKNVDLI